MICTWKALAGRLGQAGRLLLGSSGSGGGGGRFSDGSRASRPAASAWANNCVHPLHALRHHRRDAVAVRRSQREAADDLIVRPVAGDEPRPRRPARIEPLQLDLGDEDVGGAVEIDDVAPPAAARAVGLRGVDQHRVDARCR